MNKKYIKYTAIFGGPFILGILFTLTIAYFYGPYNSKTLRDPITNRYMTTESWLSINQVQKIEEDEISKWVDKHLPKNMYYGQYGWLQVSGTSRSWFGGTSIGCGGPGSYPTIPSLIYNKEIKETGKSQEQLLTEYLSEIPTWYKTHGNLKKLISDWRKRKN